MADISYGSLGKWGRMGNQMFQYAGTKGIAAKNNLTFTIPPHFDSDHPHWVYELHTAFKLTNLKPEQISHHINPYRFNIPQFHYHKSHVEQLRRPGQIYDHYSEGVDISGSYLQSYKYFETIEDEIKEDFEFKDNIINHVKKGIEGLNNPFFMHVRRGDYAKIQNHHPLLPLSYYENALKLFPEDSDCILLTDNTAWCKEELLRILSMKYPNRRIHIPTINKEHKGVGPGDAQIDFIKMTATYDMALMTICNGGIIANSTMSWWGAYLQKDRTQNICTPDTSHFGPGGWFGPANKNYTMTDLIPSNWIQAKVSK